MIVQRKFFRTVLIGIMVLFLAGFVFAQEEKGKGKERKKISDTMETVEGTVSGIGSDYIAVSYASDTEKGMEYEMLLQFDKQEIKLQHAKKLKDIKPGDTVKVQYQKVVEKDVEDKEVFTHKAKVISFMKAAPKSEILRTEETLPLKGAK